MCLVSQEVSRQSVLTCTVQMLMCSQEVLRHSVPRLQCTVHVFGFTGGVKALCSDMHSTNAHVFTGGPEASCSNVFSVQCMCLVSQEVSRQSVLKCTVHLLMCSQEVLRHLSLAPTPASRADILAVILHYLSPDGVCGCGCVGVCVGGVCVCV
jgi:hypothetical protein